MKYTADSEKIISSYWAEQVSYYHYPLYIPPTPPDPPNKKNLSATLMQAVKRRDTNWARWAFDTAFWNKIELTPSWHHLLQAAILKDKPMVRLLAAHGANWTEDQACCLKEIFSKEWPTFIVVFQGTGLRVDASHVADPPMLEKMIRHLAQYDAYEQSPSPSAQAPEDSMLRQEFNRQQVAVRLRQLIGKDLLQAKNLHPFVEAHQKKTYQANAQQMYDFIYTLHRKFRDGRIPEEIKQSLQTLKENGADFSLVGKPTGNRPCPGNALFGKKEPGLAKTLYDLGILTKNNFNFQDLYYKRGGSGYSRDLWSEFHTTLVIDNMIKTNRATESSVRPRPPQKHRSIVIKFE